MNALSSTLLPFHARPILSPKAITETHLNTTIYGVAALVLRGQVVLAFKALLFILAELRDCEQLVRLK